MLVGEQRAFLPRRSAFPLASRSTTSHTASSVCLSLGPALEVLVCWGGQQRLPVTPAVEVILGVILRWPLAQAWAHGGQLIRTATAVTMAAGEWHP